MNKDLCIPVEGGVVNIRVGAIILKDGKFLMAGNERFEHLYSVGGRIKFGETAEEAVVREVLEETGVKMDVDRLGFIHENFFMGDIGIKLNQPIYEISFFFYMKVPEDFEPVCMSFTETQDKEFLEWISVDDERTYYPEFFRTELLHPVNEVKHFITRDI